METLIETSVKDDTWQKATYGIDFNAVACHFSIKVNDIPIYSMDVDGQMSTVLPMLNLGILKSGIQELVVEISPLAGQKELGKDAHFAFSVDTRDKLYPYEGKQQIKATLGMNIENGMDMDIRMPVENGINIKNEKLPYTKKFTFNATVPYIIDTLDNAIDLSKVPNGGSVTKTSILAIYKELTDMIKNKSFDTLKLFHEQKEVRAAKILYLSEKESKDRMDGLVEEFSKNSFVPVPIKDDVVVRFYANGKLAKLENPDGSDPFVFTSGEEGELRLGYMFYMPKDNNNVLKVF